MLGERAANLLFDLMHRRTTGVGRRDRDDDAGFRLFRVANDPELDDAQHRHFGILHRIKDLEQRIARQELVPHAAHQLAPG